MKEYRTEEGQTGHDYDMLRVLTREMLPLRNQTEQRKGKKEWENISESISLWGGALRWLKHIRGTCLSIATV